jgi:hypothetical protein
MRDTSYAEERATSSVGANRIERIYVKEFRQEEIRLSWWPNGKMAPRPLDVPEEQLIELVAKGIADGVLSGQFLPKLIVAAAQAAASRKASAQRPRGSGRDR